MQNRFDPQQTRNDLAFSQGAAQLFGQVANEVAGAQIRKAGWKEDSAAALALHAVIGAAAGYDDADAVAEDEFLWRDGVAERCCVWGGAPARLW
ncbi:Hemolysin [Granulibacter bethesdensis]|uniref:Hemolysin n=1 Tax=Granulibacter bethesdensis TaxID=364410 RepID=A0AAC9P9I5_9PROT|nr:hypothetical protein [Granulibacter bethesdensis]APH55054.1 Hemolysin [Granulibacter bethesdensis]APH62640.1 Hemolysin [Granulibacter bethesdensis]